MEMKLATILAIVTALLTHHLSLATIPIADHTTPGSSSSAGFSFPLFTNHTFHYRADGFLHWQHGLRADMLRPLGDSSLAENITNQGLEMSITPAQDHTLGVYIGTGHGRQWYLLKVDTSSIVSWIQCEPCIPQATQHGPIFDTAASPTYRIIPGTTRACESPFEPVNNGTQCKFSVTDPRPMHIEGYLSEETFSNGKATVYPDFLFGCAHTVENFQNRGIFAGIISIGQLPTSLVMQLAALGLANFSYCLSGGTQMNRQGFLLFGTDVPQNRQYKTTRILPALRANESEYYINLVGLSLGEHRLDRIRAEMFARRNDGQGGCVIDLATPLTVLVDEAYRIVEEAVWKELQRHNAQQVKHFGFALCVRATKAIKGHFPSMSLHFLEEEAVLVLSPAQLFLMMNDEKGQIACLAMMPGHRTIIGAFQQVDTRFVYDVKASRLSFSPESCNRDTTKLYK